MPEHFFENCQRIQRDRSINLAMLGKLRPPPRHRTPDQSAAVDEPADTRRLRFLA
jgi:hypothetical protein